MNLCRNGHDKDVVGTVDGGGGRRKCKKCASLWMKAFQSTPRGRASGRRADKKYRATPRGQATHRAERRRYYQRHSAREIEYIQQWRRRNPEHLEKAREWRRKIKARYGSLINYFWAMQIKESL